MTVDADLSFPGTPSSFNKIFASLLFFNFNLTLATLSSVGTYDEIDVCTFMEFNKMIRINNSGIGIPTMYGIIVKKKK